MEIKKLKPFINGKYVESKTDNYTEVFNPSTGEVIALVPNCTKKELSEAVSFAKNAFKMWKEVPIRKRVSLMFNLHKLIERDMEELTILIATENGKCYSEAAGDIGKAKEMVELACSAPSLLMGESLMDTSLGYDTVLYNEPLGVCAGIAPWNFPAMIPMGWMAPLAIVCGNTYILKPALPTPMTSLKMAALYKEAGFPDGVLNVVPVSNDVSENLLSDEDIKAITFVGSTKVGLHVYKTAAKYGKRVQALCQAKNHALILKDAPIEETVSGIINSSFGCAGERCMALPVIVVEDEIADRLIVELKKQCEKLEIGPAYDKRSNLGPVVTKNHKNNIEKWIEQGIKEGAEIVLDGRKKIVEGFEDGFYIGPTIFDRVQEGMSVGDEEIFGPVLCIKRVKNFSEGIEIMNKNPYANGSVIYTQSGYYARKFAKYTDGGMVGINVGIPVPYGIFPFTGHKKSFFGDLHVHGKDSFKFFTQRKCVTSRWFDVKNKSEIVIDTWDGSLA